MRFAPQVLVSVLALVPCVAFAAPTSQSCLEIDDARNTPITVEIDGYSGYWVLAPNQTYTIVSTPDNTGPPLRSASFSFRVYDGDARAGTKAGLYDQVSANFTGVSYGTSQHTMLTYLEPPASNDPRNSPVCRDTGVWVAIVHD
jgi:hypothetical protein